MRFRSSVIPLLSLVILATAAWRLCRPRAGSDFSEGDVPAAPTSDAVPSSAAAGPGTRPAEAAEIPSLLDRFFDGAVEMDPGSRPAFATGDFNGDGIADLAAAVRARGEPGSKTLGAPRARWILQDAIADAGDGVRPPPPVVPQPDERLLAVVHGGGTDAWRDARLSQAHLVKNASGPALRSRPLEDMPPEIRMKVIRAHTGDVIEVARDGRPGVVFWTAAAHVWAALPSPPAR